MTNEIKYNQLTKKIQEAVPEIMKLEVGCIIKNFEKEKVRIISCDDIKVLTRAFNLHHNDSSVYYIFRKNIKEIIGRDITLEDIIVSYYKVVLGEFKSREMNENLRHNQTFNFIIMNWRLNKPLQDQDQKTIDLLWNLICKE